LEPWDIDAALMELIGAPDFCRHLHLPIQSGCDAILEKMNRPMTSVAFEQLLFSIRSRTPEIAITTDIMVGFPGESDAHFQTSLSFIRQMGFAGGHVFRYSARPWTPAKDYPGSVGNQTSKARSALMRATIQRSSDQYHSQFTGKTARVLWETCQETETGRHLLRGLTDHYIKVEAVDGADRSNTISETLLETWDGKRFRGTIIP
jgi:threonylcarbamoyladenosine tRNA methylthiotransferase MtaB